MRVYNCLFKDEQELRELSKHCAGHPCDQALIQVFTSDTRPEFITALITTIQQALPGIPLLGVTTAGEVLSGTLVENETVLSLTLFDKVTVTTALCGCDYDDQYTRGAELTRQLVKNDTRCLLVFATGLVEGGITNGAPLLKGIASEAPELMIAGGQAGNYQGDATFAFTQQGLVEHGFAMASLNGCGLKVHGDYSLGWVPIGKRMTVTESQGSRVISIDHQPVVELYRHYLGEDVAQGLPMSAVDFPLVFDQSGVQIARHANKVFPDGSMDFLADVSVGDQARFAYCHAGLIQEKAINVVNHLQSMRPEAVFVYSCVCRKWTLGKDVNAELSPVDTVASNAGFFSFGEYFHHQGENLFLTQTMTVLAMSESEGKASEIQPPFVTESESRHFSSVRVLHHLIEQSTRELERANLELEQLAETDALTGVANKRKLMLNLDQELKRAVRTGRSLSLMMIDVDHFKGFNDSYGHVAGDECLKLVADCIATMVQRPGDLVSRYGGEEFCCLMPLTDLEGAVAIAEKIRTSVELITLHNPALPVASNITVSLGVISLKSSKGFKAEEVIELADQQLYQAKNQGRNRVCSRQG